MIKFNNTNYAKKAEKLLKNFIMESDNQKIFNVDNRGKSLFVELIYPKDILPNYKIVNNNENLTIQNFKSHISFVAIKNGEHNGIGFVSSNFKITEKDKIPLKDLYKILKSFS